MQLALAVLLLFTQRAITVTFFFLQVIAAPASSEEEEEEKEEKEEEEDEEKEEEGADEDAEEVKAKKRKFAAAASAPLPKAKRLPKVGQPKAKRPLAASAAGPPKRTKVTADAKSAGAMDVEEEAEADAGADAKVEYLDEYDPDAEDSFIEAGDPLLLGWPGKRWSYAIAKSEYDKDDKPAANKVTVHHYSFDTSCGSFLPSWVQASVLAAYVADPDSNPAPQERLQAACPKGWVAYEDAIIITSQRVLPAVLLTGEVASLQAGFVSEEQHVALRYSLKITGKCFLHCPLCT